MFSVKTAGLPEEQRQFIGALVGGFVDAINKSNEGLISDDDFTKRIEELGKKMAGVEALEELRKENEQLLAQVKSMGESLEKLQKKGITMETINKFVEKMDEMFESEKFQDFVSGRKAKSGVFDGFSLKDAEAPVSMTNNYSGDILNSQQQNRVVSPIAMKPLHLRDILTSTPGEPESTSLTYTMCESMDRNARYVTENGRLSRSSVSFKEITTGTSRVGTYIPVSKRMLKSKVYLRAWLLTILPNTVRMAEDWGFLFGDGKGENPLGIANYEGVRSVESIISDAIVEGAAGSIVSITPYNEKQDTLIEFKDPQPMILDGMQITIENASTASGLNKTHSLIKVTDRQILLVGAALSAAEADATVKTVTWKVNNGAFKSIEAPNSKDVVNTAFAVMSYGEFFPNAIVLNPLTVNAMMSEKDALGRELNIINFVNGVKYIGTRPIVEYSGIQAGKYLIGDFSPNGASIVDYTAMTLEWASDVDYVLSNQVALIVQEELIFPVYMPWAFAYGDLAVLKAAITKPVTTTSTGTTTTETSTNKG